jgi:hypothetical protein
MRKLLAILACLTSSVVYAQSHPVKIALTSSSNVPSADIVKDMAKQCPKVSVTLDATKADFTIEASKTVDILDGTDYGRFKFTLFDRDGTAIFSTSTRRIANAVKDMCTNIKKHS